MYNGAGTLNTLTPRSETILVANGNLALADGTQASGQIVFITAASFSDGDTLTLSDGIHTPTVFEFRLTGSASAGNVEVDISGATTADDVAGVFVTALTGVGNSLLLTGSNASGTVTITSDVAGTQGNVTTWASDNSSLNSAITQPTGGAGLVPTSGNSLGIADGQLGVISLGKGGIVPDQEFILTGQTTSEAPVIQIIQGTPNSSDVTNVGPYQYTDKAYVASAPINSKYPIVFSSKVCQGGEYSSFAIGAADGSTGAIPETDSSNYKLNVVFEGVRKDFYYGTSATDGIHINFTSQDYTTLSSLYTDPRDHIVQNVAYRVNLQSKLVNHTQGHKYGKKPVVAFAINTGGGSGTTLTAAAAASVGTAIDFFTKDGVTTSYVVDEAFKTTVASWIAKGTNDVDGDSTIEVIDLSTAGTASGKTSDVIMLMALDEGTPVVRNDLKPVKNRLSVGVQDAFLPVNITLTEMTYPTEEEGTGERWLIEYENRAAHQVYSQRKWGTNYELIEVPNYIDKTKNYTAYIIFHDEVVAHPYQVDQRTPHKTIILVECSQSTGTSDSTTIDSLNAILAPWLNSATVETSSVSPITF